MSTFHVEPDLDMIFQRLTAQVGARPDLLTQEQ